MKDAPQMVLMKNTNSGNNSTKQQPEYLSKITCSKLLLITYYIVFRIKHINPYTLKKIKQFVPSVDQPL